MTPRVDGTPPYKLDSISWRKPGILEVQISTYALSMGFVMPAAPLIVDYVTFSVTPLLEAVRARNEGVATRVEWVFRAGQEMPDSPTDRQEDDRKSQWSMEVSLMQMPIAMHPNLSRIMEVGGGAFKDGEVDFPRLLNGVKNPYYGTKDFVLPGVTMTCQTVETSSGMSFTQIDKLGYSRKGGLEQIPVGRNGAAIGFGFVSATAGSGRRPWLLVEHSVRRAGNEQYESKTWRYGGVMGWPDPVYDADYSFTNTTDSPGGTQSPLGAA
jgi:hypothetical protein